MKNYYYQWVGISETIRLLSTCLFIPMLYVFSLVVRTSDQKHLLRWKISKLIKNYSILYLINNTNDPNSGEVFAPSPSTKCHEGDTKISTNLSIDSNNNSSPTDDDADRKFNEWLAGLIDFN